jgi:predicted amidohydrolase YtcJ
VKKFVTFLAGIGFCLQTHAIAADNKVDNKPLIVFVAKKIITMEPSMPKATAVAIADGKIVSVGNVKSMQNWMKIRGAKIDTTFKDKVLMPGFIDAHVHPSLPAILTQFPFLAPDDWALPTGVYPGAKTHKAYVEKLKAYVKNHKGTDIPFITWGYHQLWHGKIYKPQLNKLFPNTPVMLWHRSFHEIIANDAALTMLGIGKEQVKGKKDIDWKNGHFKENGLIFLLPKMKFLFAPARYEKGMRNFIEMMHQSGVTTAMDMGTGIFGDPVGETRLIHKVMDGDKAPARIILTPIITDFLARKVSITDALKEIKKWNQINTNRVMFDGHFKIMMDGAIYSGLSQYNFPGYMDGHQGQWLAPLATTYKWAKAFWNNGYQLHAHTNGDKSAQALITIIRKLQAQKPRFDHRATLEHFAYATNSQVKQMKQLGMVVSANPYYQYILSDIYGAKWLGNDRAKNMVPLNAVVKANIPFALHSDCPMAPLSPLTLAQAAVNRDTINGNKTNQREKISIEQALKAITIDAAWIMRWEDKIGSIRAGKKADFVILEQDPYDVPAQKLKDIPIWGVVFEGKIAPVKKSNP